MKIQTICQYCSAGCSIGLNIDNGKEVGIIEKKGSVFNGDKKCTLRITEI